MTNSLLTKQEPTISVSNTPGQPETGKHLVYQATRSVKWSFLYNVVPRLVTPFSTIILAALLTPADFGLVAIATFIIALARIVVDLGLGKTVIQRQTEVNEAASISLWTSLVTAATLYVLLWIAAPWIAVAYDNDRVINVIRVAAIALPLTALVTVPKALLRRNLEFQSLFWVHSSFLVIQAVAAVMLAVVGLGYWAIILGQLIGLTVSVGVAWQQARWQPTLLLNWPILRSMLGFSSWVMAAGFQNWLLLYADNAIAGLFLGVQGLGIYALGFNIAIIIPGFLGQALGDVAYPSFCKIQKNPQEVGQNLVKLQTLTGAVLFPVALGITAIAPTAIKLLYGDKWPGLGVVIAILVLMPGLGCIWTLNENAYQAIGRPDIWTKLAGFSLLALIPLLWLAAPYGLVVFTLVRFGGGWLLPLGNMLIGTHILGVPIRQQIQGFVAPLSFSLVMFTLVIMLIQQLGPFTSVVGWMKLLSIAAFGAAVYLLLLWRGNRAVWDRLYLGLHQMFVPEPVSKGTKR